MSAQFNKEAKAFVPKSSPAQTTPANGTINPVFVPGATYYPP